MAHPLIRTGPGVGECDRMAVAALSLALVLVASLLGSCGPTPAPIATSTAASPAAEPPIETKADLIAALERASGESVRLDRPADAQFGVQGQIVALGQESIAVYAFPDSASRTTAQSEIDPEGPTFQGQPLAGWSHPRIWGVGRLLVVYDGDQGGTFLLLSGLLGDPIGLGPPSSGHDEPYPPAVAAAIGALAQAEAVDPGQIEVLDYEPATWPDGCLGLPEQGESCTAGQVQGWQVSLRLGERAFEVRTDELGQRVGWRP